MDIQVRGESLQLGAEIGVGRERVGEMCQPGVLGADTVSEFDGLVEGEVRVMRLVADSVESDVLQALKLL